MTLDTGHDIDCNQTDKVIKLKPIIFRQIYAIAKYLFPDNLHNMKIKKWTNDLSIINRLYIYIK